MSRLKRDGGATEEEDSHRAGRSLARRSSDEGGAKAGRPVFEQEKSQRYFLIRDFPLTVRGSPNTLL